MNSSAPRVFTIPPHADFLATLAQAMRRGWLPYGPDADETAATVQAEAFPAFAGWRIYLPTRRAARHLASSMLQAEDEAHGVRLLPRILPLGDVDEDELLLMADAEIPAAQHDDKVTVVPPAVPPLPRLFALAELMLQWAQGRHAQQWRLAQHLRQHPGAAYRLARSLARLIDSFENEEVPLKEVARLWGEGAFAAERPEHMQAAQQFLAFLADAWPQWLKERGMMDAAARRARLIRQQAQWLRDHPPSVPVIAAGSTGSMPATAHLLATIARLPTGCVVLPGLDPCMDDASWQALEPGHPQYGLKKLLEKMGVDRTQVRQLSAEGRGHSTATHDAGAARTCLLSEALRPVRTTNLWRERLTRKDVQQTMREGAEGLHVVHASTRRQEALAIALLMRETLEQPGRTCMLITPDRTLARAVRAELARWDVEVDDSAGQPLIDTPPGNFLKLLMQAALHDMSPRHLVALLEHPLACFGLTRAECARAAADLELAVLRPMLRFDGLAALPTLARNRQEQASSPQASWCEHPGVRYMNRQRWRQAERLARALADMLQPLASTFAHTGLQAADEMLQTLLRVAEQITTPRGHDSSLLWQGDDGEALAAALAEVLIESGKAPHMRPADLAAFLETELAMRALRPSQPSHARLSILGLLEARLLRADRMILGGLNEGIWPEVAQNDPWLTRADRDQLKLPVPERRMGLSAHDFVQAAGGGEVWLTCAERIDQQPAEPSRWIVRLRAVMKAAGLDQFLERDCWPLKAAAAMDAPGQVRPVQPPRPMPPVHLRPLRMSASRVRTLLRDPYAIFARQILRLEPLDSLDAVPTPALFGTMIHAALEEFVRVWPRELPKNAEEELLRLFEDMHKEYIGDAAHLEQVRGRLRRMAEAWVEQCERRWRGDGELLRIHVESEGGIAFEANGHAFRLTARADRMDVLRDGALRIIDYKTGTLPSRHPASANYDPQMDLEAAIAMAGGFGAAGDACDVRELILARLSGGDENPLELANWHIPGRKRNEDKRDLHQRAKDALNGLKRLLAGYMDEAQPYLPLDHGQREHRPGDFDHLNRWREWLSLLSRDDADVALLT